MRSRVAPALALAVGFLTVAGCSSGSSTTVASSSPAPSSSTTTSTTAPTTTTDPIVPAASPEEAISNFISAWRNGDQAAASSIASAAAVQAVFGAGEPGRVEDRGCNTPPPNTPVLCVYRTAAGELQLRVQPRPDGWFVDQAVISD
jgi:hypothetical protein